MPREIRATYQQNPPHARERIKEARRYHTRAVADHALDETNNHEDSIQIGLASVIGLALMYRRGAVKLLENDYCCQFVLHSHPTQGQSLILSRFFSKAV